MQQSFARDRYETDGGIPVALYQKEGFPLDRKLNPRGDFDKYRDWQTQVRFEYNLPGNLRLQDQFFTQVKRTEYLNAEGPTYVPATNTVTRNASYLVSNRRPKQNYLTLSGSHRFLVRIISGRRRTTIRNTTIGKTGLDPLKARIRQP